MRVKNFPVSQSELRAALEQARAEQNGGLNLDMWATIVDRDGKVIAVAFTGDGRGDQWPGSRVISAQKANTANAFSLNSLALSTANLFSAVQPGGSLFGLQESNPVDTRVAYGGDPADYGTPKDFMVGKRIGGVNVFGGGLALYDARGRIIGAVGVRRQHHFRHHRRVSAGGFGHPDCGNGEKPIGEGLPTTNPISHPMS